MKSLLLQKSIETGCLKVKAPSNIALVKYWGKKGHQLPCNPSVSFTLSEAFTETEISWEFEDPTPKEEVNIHFHFGGDHSEKFAERVRRYFNSLIDTYPFLGQLKLTIRTRNSFPHSAGIASSASAMASLGLALCAMERKFFKNLKSDEEFYRKASYLARVGSGSAARSVYGGVVSWGQYENDLSSDEFASPVLNIHSVFEDYRDSILIVDSKPKSVSSSEGHKIMNISPYSSVRFELARQRVGDLISLMQKGDLERFVSIVENEALELHGMMLTSNYMLLRPNTLALIEELRAFRRESAVPVCFTLDAGPNLHLLYPSAYAAKVKHFIDQMKPYYESFLHDHVGTGPQIHD